MLSRNRLAAACLAASLLATPFAALGKTQSESLLQQAIDLVSRWLPAPPTHEAPATQVVESAFSPDGGAEALVLKAIGAARSSIRVAAYSFTSPPVTRALLAAKRRGVNVAVVVDDKGNRAKSSKQALNLLVNAGIPTRTIDAYAIHHDKYLVIDAEHVETGSFNYSASAASRNSENVVVVWNNPQLASRYLTHWQSRFDQGTPYRSSY
ncbi:endonuclease [Burkholderia cenocepacia]|uniref:phospholipase D family nuclease n=1 Tax=Burkholderia cenocepacia TaxID=95486 RepID=UPI0009822936|nr:phospholipase D family protein [Burkholderia cenocepacia]ONZ20924.1 endonuclease [Burkholderia cenocepacia]